VLYNNEIDLRFSELSQKAQFDKNEMTHNLDNTLKAARSITVLYGSSDRVVLFNLIKTLLFEIFQTSRVTYRHCSNENFRGFNTSYKPTSYVYRYARLLFAANINPSISISTSSLRRLEGRSLHPPKLHLSQRD
jgi:hypothetical protein